MQQPPQMMPMIPPPFPNANITTEQIQKYLDENKKLILAILDNQNLGKLAECAHFQVKLQQNLMYLAAIADAQPQAPTVPPQMPPHAVMQQGGHFMQHPQVGPQPPVFAQKVPLQFNPQQMQEQQQQHPLHHQHPYSIQGQMGMRPGANNGIHAMHHAEVTPSGSGGPPSTPGLGELARGGASGSSADGRGGEQDAGAAALEASTGNGTGSTAAGHGSGDAEPSYLKGPGEGGK